MIAVDMKRIETRSFGTRYRGPLAIQAAKTIPNHARADYALPENRVTRSVLRREFGIHRASELTLLPVGCIQLVCNLVDVMRVRNTFRLESLNLLMPDNYIPKKYQTPGWLEFGNYQAGRWLWLLDNIQRLRKPVPCRGYQGFWTLSEKEVREVEAQL